MRLRHGPAGDAGGLHARPPARGARGGGRGARRLLLGVALAGALLAASACEVDVGVDVEVAENGSGTVAVGVSLDRAASDALGDLAAQLDLADLALAGWDVAGPAREADNLLWVRATKRFGSAEELPSVLAEIAGPDVFEGFQLRRRTEFAEQTWEVAGQVDPAAALPELFDTLAFNEGLRDRIREVAGDFGDDVPLYGLTVSLNIDLPGELRSGGGDFTWTALTADPSAGTATAVRMTAHEENTTAKTLRLVGLAAAALFVLALLLNVLGWWYIRRYRKRRARALMAKADSEQIPAVVTGTGASAAREAGGVLAAGEGDDSSGAAGGAAVTGGDEIDWEEFEDLGSYEDLSGGLDDLSGDFDDLSGGGTGTPADDWTASLEAGADAVPEPAAMAAPGGPVEEGESSGPAAEPPPGPDAGTGPTPLISRAFSLAVPPQPADAAGATTEEAAAAPGDEADSLHEPEEVDEPEKPGEAEADDDADEGDPEEIDEPAATIEPEAVEGPDGEPGSDDEPDVDGEPDTDPEDRADDGPEPEDQADDDEPDVDSKPDTDPEDRADDGPEPEDQADDDDEPDVDSETDTDDEPETDDEDQADDEPGPETDDEPDDGDPGAGDQPDADDEPGDDEPDVAVAPQAAEATTPTPPSHTLRLVVIGGWGVLFQPADPAGELLVPYLQQAGATASPAEIRESYRLATLGRLTPDELWESCGLTGEPTWTHGPYTGRMSVSAGAAEFVRSLLRRRIEVACVTNDVSDWSWRLRTWTGFEALSPWVVSSDIGIRKPDPGVFEMLRRVAEIPFANCLVIDNDVRTLDAARSLGMSTGLFGARAGDAAGAPASHPTVGDFTDLLRPT